MKIKIGKLSFRVIEKTEEFSRRLFEPFIVEDDGEECYEIYLLEKEPCEREGGILFHDDRLMVMDGQDDIVETRIYRNPLNGEKFAFHNIYRDHSEVYFWPVEAEEKDLRFLHLMALALEKIASFQQCFVLHSSSILVDGEMVLFSAPSGTGKSTQADLWNEHRNAKIVNGDRNLIFEENGKFYAQGWVLSGSSEHRHNVSAPIKAIVSLEKSLENIITELKGVKALRQLHREVISNSWDRECTDQELDFLTKLLSEIPVLHLACRKEESAVEVLEECLQDMDVQ